MISAIILAAGRSTRMGRPKMLLRWGNVTVLERVITVFGNAGIEDILIVTGGAVSWSMRASIAVASRLALSSMTMLVTLRRLGSEITVSEVPTSDAHASIAMGNEFKLKNDYTKAIRSYQKALGNAGDQTGFVYQNIARCFQDKGDKSSATANYERAVSELQKLVDSGRDMESAKAAIRACQNGIKVCKE